MPLLMVSVTLTPPTIVQNESFLLPFLHDPSIFILIHIIKHSLRGLQFSLLVHSSLTTTPGEGGEREKRGRRKREGGEEGREREKERREFGVHIGQVIWILPSTVQTQSAVVLVT